MNDKDTTITQDEIANFENVKYSPVPDIDDPERMAIKIDEGKFKNCVFAFKDIKIDEEEWENEDEPKISFDFDVLTFPEEMKDFDKIVCEDGNETAREFQVVVAKILMNTIMTAAQTTIDEHA